MLGAASVTVLALEQSTSHNQRELEAQREQSTNARPPRRHGLIVPQ